MRGLVGAVAGTLWWLVGTALTLGAGVITYGRLAGQPTQRWVELVSFAPIAGVAHLVALVLLLLVARAVRSANGAVRLVVAVPTVIAALGTGMHVAFLAPQLHRDVPEPDGGELTVMTANLYHGSGTPASIAAAVDDQDVDVLVLTEVSPDVVSALGRADAGKRLRYQAGDPLNGVSGTAVLSSVPIESSARLPLRHRAYKVVLHAPSGAVTLLAVHPTSPVESVREWRSDHEKLLVAAQEAEGPTMVVGDLNATLDHEVLARLADAGLEDAVDAAGAGWVPTWPSQGYRQVLGVDVPPVLSLDHVLVTPDLTVGEVSTAEISGSDHRALIADVAPRPSS